jgi:hypothetical protein
LRKKRAQLLVLATSSSSNFSSALDREWLYRTGKEANPSP